MINKNYYLSLWILITVSSIIYPQSIKINDPEPGKKYSVPSQLSVTWQDTTGVPLDSVDILVTLDNGRSWITIAKNVAAKGKDRGWFDWEIASENSASTQCRIKIKTLYGNNRTFEMKGNFLLVKKKSKDYEVSDGWNIPLSISQGLLRYNSQNYYTGNITAEAVYNFNDNNQSAGVILGANISNETWEYQGGVTFNQKIMNIEFENIILAKLQLNLTFMIGTHKRYVLAAGPVFGLGIGKAFLKYSCEFNNKQDAYEVGIGVNLDYFFK